MTGTDTLPVVHVGTIVEMTSPPTRSPEQREAAREKAAEARRLRAEIKDRLKMGLLNFEELMAEADSNEIVGKMKVLAALESLPRLGKVKARRTMDEVGIAASRRLRGLGHSQRAQLLARFSTDA
jgi:hypothetical protein